MQVDDVRSALTFLETEPIVDARRLGLFGVSLGASIAVATAGVDGRAKVTVVVSGPMDLGRVWRAYPGLMALGRRSGRRDRRPWRLAKSRTSG